MFDNSVKQNQDQIFNICKLSKNISTLHKIKNTRYTETGITNRKTIK